MILFCGQVLCFVTAAKWQVEMHGTGAQYPWVTCWSEGGPWSKEDNCAMCSRACVLLLARYDGVQAGADSANPGQQVIGFHMQESDYYLVSDAQSMYKAAHLCGGGS